MRFSTAFGSFKPDSSFFDITGVPSRFSFLVVSVKITEGFLSFIIHYGGANRDLDVTMLTGRAGFVAPDQTVSFFR